MATAVDSPPTAYPVAGPNDPATAPWENTWTVLVPLAATTMSSLASPSRSASARPWGTSTPRASSTGAEKLPGRAATWNWTSTKWVPFTAA